MTTHSKYTYKYNIKQHMDLTTHSKYTYKYNIKQQMDDGWTAFMWAAFCGQLDISRLLLDRGCRPDNTDRWKNSFTSRCSEWTPAGIKVPSRKAGISPFVVTHKGETPYDLAAAKVEYRESTREVSTYLQVHLHDAKSYSLKVKHSCKQNNMM
ncbi:unnamed protein product [Mytilus edulis]|uniref:Uncharacterized protein n=1 Tax=Mytilus edulis TaxID=6550 RepID=A0A8S3SD53_MYTED|nr:unnamed protein product [Mytilus edulis]